VLGEGRRALYGALGVAMLVACAVLPAAAADPGNAAPEIAAVSTKAEYVSGGDVLVRVRAHDEGTAKHLRIERDGVDVTSSFHAQPDGSLLGLVDGLSNGEHAIVARANGGGRGTPPGRTGRLDVVNHPITGGLFSGPQQQPFFCETVANGLGPALDASCSAPTQVTYRYRTTAGSFATLADPTTRPADLAQTTVDGRTVDYIVRVERGTIDRAVYEIAALYDPAAAPSPFSAEPGWNEKLVYTFGGGCNVGYHQGVGTGGVVNDLFLSRGFAVASSTLNVLDNNCSDVISAEVALMVKEHFIEEYGPVRYTIGWGGSGGAIQQQLIANNYPGILDGIVPAASFPDATTLNTVSDCRLLATYFASPAATALGWTAAQQTAASGFGTFGNCRSWHLAFASRTNALEACPSAVPVSARYNPTTNPGGIRCTSTEQVANQLGRDPATGFVYRPLDDVGVQFGLTALKSGAITPEQFVSLNEGAGGYDVVGRVVAQRTVADPLGLTRAYQTGRVNNAGLGLASTPIIDVRQYTDPASDIHTRFWSFVVRQRLVEANGTAANQVQFVSNAAGVGSATTEAFTRMDDWLAATAADDAPGTAAERTIRNRPAGLTDTCWTSATNAIHETFAYQGSGMCDTLYPSYGDTRSAAGAPLTEDVQKCRLAPVDWASYGVTFTPEQQARLAALFPTGVCDWSQPGVEQQAPLGTWLTWGS
jgi:Tannase-like family of unknown function (DUF6351)